MALKSKTHEVEKAPRARQAPQQQGKSSPAAGRARAADAASALQRAASPSALRPADVLVLQREVGNRAVQRIFSGRPQALRPRPSTPAKSIQRKAEEEPSDVKEEPLQAKLETDREKENRTGLPDTLKAGIENLSGMTMDDVRVHYNSSKPSEVRALAYTQGADVYLGPDEEEHLPHEAWHVVQQKQGRVKPTLQARGAPINDDDGLEREADAKGAQAFLLGKLREDVGAGARGMRSSSPAAHSHPVIQRVGNLTITDIDYNPANGHHKNQAVLMDKYGPALVQAVTTNLDEIAPKGESRRERQRQQPLRTRITNEATNYAAWADLQAADVDALVTQIVNHLLRNPGEAEVNAAALRPRVDNAVRFGLPSAASDSGEPEEERSDLKETEIGAVNALLDVATTKSSAKATPNVISSASLNDAVGSLGDAVRAIRNKIVARNNLLLGRMGREIGLIDQAELGGAAGYGLGIRSMHQNGAGWLPSGAVNLPTTLDALLNQINQAEAAILTDDRQAQIRNLTDQQQALARRGIKKQAVGQIMNALPERTRIMLIWGSYAQNQGELMNYVEFNLPARINRMMYDYVNGRFFITAHYNWYKGYNPFFEVTGLFGDI